MKKWGLCAAVTLLSFLPAAAQERATTESGRKILVFPDGTWTNDTKIALKAIEQGVFSKPKLATEKIRFLHDKTAIYFDPAIWKPVKQEEPSRLQLQHKDGDGYALVVSERMQISLESLKGIALMNAKNAAPDARITREEKRLVNGVETLFLQINGTIKGISFQYFGYYYAGKEGCMQILTYTSENLFDEFKKDFTDFLNGFVLE